MVKHIIVSYDTGLINVNREYDQEEIWEKLNLYFNFKGLDSNSFDLKKNFDKSMTSLKNTKKAQQLEVDLEDVFFKMFKKYKFKAKKKHIRELAILFQVLTTTKLEINKKIISLMDYAHDEQIDLYCVANGQCLEIVNELKALLIYDSFKKVVCSSSDGYAKPNTHMLEALIKSDELVPKKGIYVTNGSDKEVEMAKSLGYPVAYLGDEPDFEVDCYGKSDHIIKFINK